MIFGLNADTAWSMFLMQLPEQVVAYGKLQMADKTGFSKVVKHLRCKLIPGCSSFYDADNGR